MKVISVNTNTRQNMQIRQAFKPIQKQPSFGTMELAANGPIVKMFKDDNSGACTYLQLCPHIFFEVDKNGKVVGHFVKTEVGKILAKDKSLDDCLTNLNKAKLVKLYNAASSLETYRVIKEREEEENRRFDCFDDEPFDS